MDRGRKGKGDKEREIEKKKKTVRNG